MAGRARRPHCGWWAGRQRRTVLLRRKLDRPLVILEHTQPEQPRLSFAEVGSDREVWEYAALVTSLDGEILRWVSCTATGATARMLLTN